MNGMLRRIASIILIAILVVAVIAGFFWLRLKFSPSLSSEKAVPDDFVLCLETENYYRLSSGLINHSDIWDEFLNYEYIRILDQHLHKIDSLSRTYDDLGRLLQGRVFISIHPVEDQFTTLFALNSPENNATEQLLKLISNDSEIRKEKYENVTIYHTEFVNGFPDRLSFYEHRNILVLSPSSDLLKRSVLHVNGDENAFSTTRYKRISTTLGKDVEAHIFVNFDLVDRLVSNLLIKEKSPDLSGFTTTAALDLEIKPDRFILNGFSASPDTVYDQLSIFEGQDPVEQHLFPVIPSNVVYLKWFGLSDPDIFRAKTEMPENPERTRNFREGFFKHFNGQAAEVILKKDALSFSNYLLISLKSRGQADDYLRDNLPIISKVERLNTEKVVIDDNNLIEAFQIPLYGMESILLGNMVNNSGYKWYCFYENNLLLGQTVRDLREFAYLNILGKTIENDDYFEGLKENFSSKSNFFAFFDPSQFYQGILELLKPEVSEIANQNTDSWKKINIAGFQSTVTENMNYFRVFLNYSGEIRELVNTVWERKLDSDVAIKPAVVLNHNNGEKEIFIQDEDQNIYLISNSGAILWKQKVEGQILSEIFQIDYYNNDKLQYLFNTASHIYLIDRNGNSVEDYPVKLRQEASSGISLFDYDNNRRFRIPVPTVENDILMYDIQGNIVSGWRFRRSDHQITSPLQHIRIGGNDYIIAKDDFRLYLLDRRGRIREKPSKQIDFSVRNPVYYQPSWGNNKARLIASDKNGDVYAFYFDGKVEKIVDNETNENHFFVPADLNGDRKPEYIFADSMKLEVLDDSGDLLFSEIYPEAISREPVIYTFSSTDKKIGIVVTDAERIYLVNNDGSLYNGFPLRGASLFSISSFPSLKDRFNLLVGNNDNFLYNYSVK